MPQEKNTQAKRDFDARALENEYDHIYKNEAQRWLHYIHRMGKKSRLLPPEQLSSIKSAYEDFMRKAKIRKSAVKNGQATVAEFRNWTIQQLDSIL